MGLFDSWKKPIVDVVSWNPQQAKEYFAWKYRHPKYPDTSKNLSTFTQLIVAESQEAILFSKGQMIGKFGPGKHTLNTENLPLIRDLFGLPFGGNNPFTAEVWFVNKLMPLNIDWSTDTMMYHDPDYNTMVPLVAEGRYGLRILDAEKFLLKLVGTSNSFTSSELTDHFFGATVAKTKSTLLQFIMGQGVGLKKISAFLDPLSKNLMESMTSYWADYGFLLHNFYITSIKVDETHEHGERILRSMSQQSAQAIAGYTWQQSQAFELGDKAIDSMSNASGHGGLLGAVLATNMMNSHGSGAMMQPPAPNTQGGGHQGGAAPSGFVKKPTVYCSNCAKKFDSSMKFCPHCGDPYHPCQRCGTDNDPSANRCVSCGTPVNFSAMTCPGCSVKVEPGSAFCPECGYSLTPKGDGYCKSCGYDLKGAAFCPQCGTKNS